MTRPTFSVRASDSTLAVPVTLTSSMPRASRTPASYQPATWNTTSARDIAAWNRGRVTSPTVSWTPRASRSFPRAGSRVRTETSHPPARRTSTKCRPMSPVPPVTNARIGSAFPQNDRQDIGVLQGMLQADLLTGELSGRPPHVRVAEPASPVAVDRVAHHADIGAGLDDERVREVRLLPLRLQEDPHEPEGLVDLVLQASESDPSLRRNWHELPARELRLQLLDVVRGDEVDFVHDDECRHIDPVSRQDVDQLVLRDVLSDDDRAVQISPLPADVRDQLLVELRQSHGRVDRKAAAPAPRKRDVCRLFVEPDPGEPQLVGEDVHVHLEDVDPRQDEVAPARDGQDLLPATAAFRGAAD